MLQVIGLKIQSFCKSKPCEAVFVGKNFLSGTNRHPVLAQLLVSYNRILRIEIFLWALTTFSTVYSGKSDFHLNQFIFASGPNFDNKNLKLGTSRNT